MMSCDTPKSQLYLYLDGELAAPEALMVEQHLRTCASCQSEAAAQQRLQTLLRSTLSHEDVPEHFWLAIQRQLPQHAAGTLRPARWFGRRSLWVGLAAAALIVLAVRSQWWLADAVPSVVQEIVDSQIRSKLMGMSYEKIAFDPGAIRSWFGDKIEFSLLIPEVPRQQYTFLGVRLNYFLNRRVAEIAYTSPSHTVSFLMFADQGITLTSMRTVRAGPREFFVQTYKGYNTVLWKDGAYFCSLVSDLDMPSLLHLARQATGSGASS
jgi:anti-sigma factor RsiW